MRDWDREFGATAVEYGLLLAGIAAVIMATVATLGSKVFGLFDAATLWPW
ncbi:hypothetical protein N802_18475 [Knoellia sinensis KCTC 19936]|uniref:Flp family type IVb pilin n=2 Tax=Knoellia TaxID=136099 RepID=A0A0A0J9R6_9MICO|nr:hypothetical protein N802_18475 [Knoellia sinensis KCTC 19936]